MITSERKEVKKEMEGPRNYGNPEPLNLSALDREIMRTHSHVK